MHKGAAYLGQSHQGIPGVAILSMKGHLEHGLPQVPVQDNNRVWYVSLLTGPESSPSRSDLPKDSLGPLDVVQAALDNDAPHALQESLLTVLGQVRAAQAPEEEAGHLVQDLAEALLNLFLQLRLPGGLCRHGHWHGP